MKAVFNRAHCVVFDAQGRPIVHPPEAAHYEGFKGFLHSEDMYAVLHMAGGEGKYARTQIWKEYPQRTYDYLLGLLRKVRICFSSS